MDDKRINNDKILQIENWYLEQIRQKNLFEFLHNQSRVQLKEKWDDVIAKYRYILHFLPHAAAIIIQRWYLKSYFKIKITQSQIFKCSIRGSEIISFFVEEREQKLKRNNSENKYYPLTFSQSFKKDFWEILSLMESLQTESTFPNDINNLFLQILHLTQEEKVNEDFLVVLEKLKDISKDVTSSKKKCKDCGKLIKKQIYLPPILLEKYYDKIEPLSSTSLECHNTTNWTVADAIIAYLKRERADLQILNWFKSSREIAGINSELSKKPLKKLNLLEALFIYVDRKITKELDSISEMRWDQEKLQKIKLEIASTIVQKWYLKRNKYNCLKNPQVLVGYVVLKFLANNSDVIGKWMENPEWRKLYVANNLKLGYISENLWKWILVENANKKSQAKNSLEFSNSYHMDDENVKLYETQETDMSMKSKDSLIGVADPMLNETKASKPEESFVNNPDMLNEPDDRKPESDNSEIEEEAKENTCTNSMEFEINSSLKNASFISVKSAVSLSDSLDKLAEPIISCNTSNEFKTAIDLPGMRAMHEGEISDDTDEIHLRKKSRCECCVIL